MRNWRCKIGYTKPDKIAPWTAPGGRRSPQKKTSKKPPTKIGHAALRWRPAQKDRRSPAGQAGQAAGLSYTLRSPERDRAPTGVHLGGKGQEPRQYHVAHAPWVSVSPAGGSPCHHAVTTKA